MSSTQNDEGCLNYFLKNYLPNVRIKASAMAPIMLKIRIAPCTSGLLNEE